MLDKDNIISKSVSEVVEKIPIDEKDDRKCSFMCFTLHSDSIQRVDQYIANSRNSSCLPTRIHPMYLKKITEDILHKICTEEGAIIGIWLVLSTVKVEKFTDSSEFPGNQLADVRGGG